MENLIFRRQFILTADSVKQIYSSWSACTIKSEGKTWNLYAHPDLEVTDLEADSCRLILLGYLLDPFDAGSGNEAILNRLADQKEFPDIVEATHELNGRFLLFHITKNSFRIINDASGFRELYYLIRNKEIHCGSTPDIIKEFLGVESNPDEEAVSFLCSHVYINNSFTWVGYDTIFKDLKKLPPNFMLDLNGKEISRFWPNKTIEKHDPVVVAKECADIIRGFIQSAFERKPIHLGITAGWDSRVLLAASRDLSEKVFYYINKSEEMGEDHKDLNISRELATELKFSINILDLAELKVDNDFINVYHSNNFRANDFLLPVFFYSYLQKYDDTFTVSGTLAEGSARKYYYNPIFMRRLTGKKLARIVSFKNEKYAIKKLDEWLEEVYPLCSKLNMDVLDLYQIEQEGSNWCSLTAAEQDIVREEIRPFNSRYLMSLFWSLDIKNRLLYNPDIYQKMVAYLWPEVLNVSVNPSWRIKLINIFSKFGMELLFYKIRAGIKYLSILPRQ